MRSPPAFIANAGMLHAGSWSQSKNCILALTRYSADSTVVQERNCNFIWEGLNRPKFGPEAAMVTEPETTFGYAVVEQALMTVHSFVERKRGAFRARLIHFQRLKIVPAAPGQRRRNHAYR